MGARDRILDAAAKVLRDQGIAHATTKEIAREAACSEALLYKHFAGKQELFLGVLSERAPRLARPDELVGTGTVRDNLAAQVARLMEFYLTSFPMSASILGAPELLAAHRRILRGLGAGPAAPAQLIQAYLDAEAALGRVSSDLDTAGLARTITGAALFEAFLAVYEGADEVPDAAERSRAIVASIRV